MKQYPDTAELFARKEERRQEMFAEQKFSNLYPKYTCPVCGDWFHMPYKFCKCKQKESISSAS